MGAHHRSLVQCQKFHLTVESDHDSIPEENFTLVPQDNSSTTEFFVFSFNAEAVELVPSNQVLNLSFGFTHGFNPLNMIWSPFIWEVEMLQSVVMEVQRLYKSVMYINRKSVLYLYGISSMFDSKVCGFCRVESCACLSWYHAL